MATERSKPRYRVVLRRARGARFVRDYPAWSKYGAKQLSNWLEDKYDSGYFVEVQPWPAGDPRTYTEKERRHFASLPARDAVQLG